MNAHQGLKNVIKRVPIFGAIGRRVARCLSTKRTPFSRSEDYWIARYDSGGTSGLGSYAELADFKAEVLNAFVAQHKITSVIEFGCGDGNQLRLAKYPAYVGLDVSPKAISLCREIHGSDESKRFALMSEYEGESAQLSLSLDVIYHLVEDDVFHHYMEQLFDSSERFVIVYSSNTDMNRGNQGDHVRHRKFSTWAEQYRPQWRLLDHVPNRFPQDGSGVQGSPSDFYIFERPKAETAALTE